MMGGIGLEELGATRADALDPVAGRGRGRPVAEWPVAVEDDLDVGGAGDGVRPADGVAAAADGRSLGDTSLTAATERSR